MSLCSNVTRTKGLLCLAIPLEFVNTNTQIKMKSLGWNIKILADVLRN